VNSAAVSIATVWLALLASLVAQAPTPARAAPGDPAEVADGCARPDAKARGRTYYVDPRRGDISGDGSAGRPWDTLQHVMQRWGASLHGGDSLLLFDGDHGAPLIGARNAQFVIITAAPWQTPVVSGLSVTGARWLISGLRFQAARPGRLLTIRGGASDIVITDDSFSSQGEVGDWEPADWASKGAGAVTADGRDGTHCISITHNRIYNAVNPVALYADHTLFADNTIDNFAGDAIDYGANDLVIAHNRITNVNDLGTGQHYDAMQGFTPGGVGYTATGYANILIDGNIVIRQTNRALRRPSYLQGIDAFDADWTNLTISNNVVITNAYQAISFASVHGGRIVNNTVASDEARTNNPFAGAHGVQPQANDGRMVWIRIGDRTHQGAPSDHVILRNNLAQTIVVGTSAAAVEADHNIAYFEWRQDQGQRTVTVREPASLGAGNRLEPDAVRRFAAFDPAGLQFDLRLAPGSPAIRAGAAADAPSADILGRPRGVPPDVGAYAYRAREGSPAAPEPQP
jgi:hypothetical protein